LVLSVAVLEDIVLWAVLAVATSLAKGQLAGENNPWQNVFQHTGVTVTYMVIGLTLAPRLVQFLHGWRWNFLIKSSVVGYLFFLLFLYAAIAALLDVNLVFAAFLAGFGVVGGMSGVGHARFTKYLDPISRVSTGFFIPIYFAMVGYKLVWGSSFSLSLFLLFLLGSSMISAASFALAAYVAGFRGFDVLNLVVTKNARGGPGIVLATVAYEGGIISAPFYSTLVLTALVTSQAAGAWLSYVLSRGWPLMTGESNFPAVEEEEKVFHA
jgi:Kef-type K+ transport system membrane component KefB